LNTYLSNPPRRIIIESIHAWVISRKVNKTVAEHSIKYQMIEHVYFHATGSNLVNTRVRSSGEKSLREMRGLSPLYSQCYFCLIKLYWEGLRICSMIVYQTDSRSQRDGICETSGQKVISTSKSQETVKNENNSKDIQLSNRSHDESRLSSPCSYSGSS
jgi:hypothetical protein